MKQKNAMNTLLKILPIIILSIFAFSLTLDAESRILWLKEGGIIETLSAAGYFLCAFLMLYWGGLSYLKKYHYFFIMVVLFGLRELDFDKKFTTMGVLKSKFYVSSQVPMGEKIIGLMVVALLVYLIITILKKYSKNLLSKIKSSDPVYIGGLLTFTFLAVSKTLDGFARKMRDFNVEISKQTSVHITSMEEILELAIPIILIVTLYVYFFQSKSNK